MQATMTKSESGEWSGSATATEHREEWHRLCDDYLAAIGDDVPEIEVDELMGRACERQYAFVERVVLDTPATGMTELAFKLDLFVWWQRRFEGMCDPQHVDQAMVAAIRADLARLTGIPMAEPLSNETH